MCLPEKIVAPFSGTSRIAQQLSEVAPKPRRLLEDHDCMRDESNEDVNPFTATIQPKATGTHHETAKRPLIGDADGGPAFQSAD